jgi:outer membrane protein OmpA-like peptidoglycan-associated protein
MFWPVRKNIFFTLLFIATLSSVFAQKECPEGYVTGKNLIRNPFFDDGLTGFYSDYKKNESKDWFAGSIYCTPQPSLLHNNYRLCLDSLFENRGNLLVVDGAQNRKMVVWQQKIKIDTKKEYAFSLFFATLLKPNPAQLEISINNTRLHKPFDYQYQHCRGSIYSCNWFSGQSSEADIKIRCNNTELLGNDFVLDDIQLVECIKTEPNPHTPLLSKDSVLVSIKTFGRDKMPIYSLLYAKNEGDTALHVYKTDRIGLTKIVLKNKTTYLNIHAQGYFTQKDTLWAKSKYTEQSFEKEYILNPIDSGVIFTLKKLKFDRSSSILTDTSKNELLTVWELLTENPEVDLEIHGHTDNQGDAVKNLELSLKRAETVKNFLVEKGIKENRLKGLGFGGIKPLIVLGTDEERKQNRRVEFVVIKRK